MSPAYILQITRANAKFVIVTLFFGLMTGLMMVPAIDRGADVVREIWDEYDPVASIVVEKAPSPHGEVHVAMRVTRHRECEMLAVRAYEARQTGWQRIEASKLEGDTAPVDVPRGMTVRSSVWRLWPTTTGALRMVMIYDCGGRAVRMPVTIS